MSGFSRYKLVLALIGLIAALAIYSCKGGRTTDPPPGTNYRVTAVVIQDQNLDTVTSLGLLFRTDSIVTNGMMTVGGDALIFFPTAQKVDSVYFRHADSVVRYSGSSLVLSFRDQEGFADSLSVSIVDTFTIEDFFPPTDTLDPPWQVQLDYTASLNTEAYVVAAVKSNEAYTGAGFSDYVQPSGLSGTIPPDAFTDPTTGDPIEGEYDLFVYAISGSPDSTMSAPYLPVPLPGQLADNIDRNQVSGRFGSITVVLKRKIYVVTI